MRNESRSMDQQECRADSLSVFFSKEKKQTDSPQPLDQSSIVSPPASFWVTSPAVTSLPMNPRYALLDSRGMHRLSPLRRSSRVPAIDAELSGLSLIHSATRE